ncbi:MAG TPA: LuxR C-terminal-related transcriptional regulator [Opitutaceae bacterium]|nr:LuxR C-terminal-related transcriptional regulator [Opitutaceae bacterium]
MHSAHTSAHDWRSAADFIADATIAESFEEFAATVIKRTRALFAADLVVLNFCDCDQNFIDYRLEPDLSRQLAPLFEPFKLHWSDHPWEDPKLWRRILAEGCVTLLSDYVSSRRFRETGLWREVYSHLYAHRQLSWAGQMGGNNVWTISANRLGSDYGPRDRELARFLQPRLNSIGLRIARRDHGSRMANALSGFFLHRQSAFALLDAKGRIVEITATAQALLARATSRVGANFDGLPDSCPELRAELFRQKKNARRLFAVVQIPTVATVLVLRLGHDLTLVLFEDPAPTGKASAVRLTRREAEILGWLGEGKSNPEIAVLLSISPRTVEKHCSHLFAKLGVETRFAAALLARSNGAAVPR